MGFLCVVFLAFYFTCIVPPGEGVLPIRVSWLTNVYSCPMPCIADVFFAWDGVFSSTTPMIYEVSLGSVEGGSDIFQWVETVDPTLRINGIIYEELYVTVTAINTAGFYQTISQQIFAP